MSSNYQRFNPPGADVTFYPSPPLKYSPDYLFEKLIHNTNWQQRSVKVYDREVAQPRLTAWYSDFSYDYSGIHWDPQPMTQLLDSLSREISRLCGAPFNGVLLNLYRSGYDSIGMHSDNEVEFGYDPTIASLSLGGTRDFIFQRKDKSVPSFKIPLTHGSLLIMSGSTQRYWNHGINKTTKEVQPRINLTFRNIVNPQ